MEPNEATLMVLAIGAVFIVIMVLAKIFMNEVRLLKMEQKTLGQYEAAYERLHKENQKLFKALSDRTLNGGTSAYEESTRIRNMERLMALEERRAKLNKYKRPESFWGMPIYTSEFRYYPPTEAQGEEQ